jgi:glycosyltransferase involved in cell wall biosynthesis
MPRLNILHLTTFLQGGAGRSIVDLACAQHAAGNRVTVVTSRTSRDEFGNYPEYLDRLRTVGVTLHMCDSLFSRDHALNMRVVGMLSRSVDVTAVDIIHAHAAVPAFIGEQFSAGARRRIGLIQTQHGWGSNKTSQQAVFDLDVLSRVDRIVTTSAATGAELAALGAPRASMVVIPCGLPLRDPGQPPAGNALEAHRANGSRVIGCIGSVTANKNQRLLLEALQSIVDPSIIVVFVGEGSEALEDEARTLGLGDRVLACGYQPEASRWLPLFDLLVVPSRTEGQGLVVLEAFRAAVPVVASEVPALGELIEHRRSGFLFENGNAAALAGAIQCALSLPDAERWAMLTAARRRFDADFTIDQMVERHEKLYRSVIAGKKALPGASGKPGGTPPGRTGKPGRTSSGRSPRLAPALR